MAQAQGVEVPSPPDALTDDWLGDMLRYGENELWPDHPPQDNTEALMGMGIPLLMVT